MSIVTDSVRTGIGALSNFGSVLSSLLDNFDEQLIHINEANQKSTKEFEEVHSQLKTHDTRLQILENESAAQRKIVETAMTQMLGIEKHVDVALQDASRHMHKEILAQRTLTKMDISQLRGKMHHSMSEALSIMSDQGQRLKTQQQGGMFVPSLFGDGGQSIGELANGESPDLMTRLARLEESMGLQHSINQQIGRSMTSEDQVQGMYDHLFEEINSVNREMITVKTENKALRRLVAEMKVHQDWQDKQINDLLQALNDKERMKALRMEVSIGKRDLPKPVFIPKILQEEEDPDEVRDRRRSARRAKRAAAETRKRQKSGINPEDIEQVNEDDFVKEDNEEGGDDHDDGGNAGDEEAKDPTASRGRSRPRSSAEDNGDGEGDGDDMMPGSNAFLDDDDASSVFLEDSGSVLTFMNHTDPDGGRSLPAVKELRKKIKELTELLQAQQESMNDMTRSLNEDFTQRVGDLETSVGTFKRIAFTIDDLKTSVDTLRHKVERVTGGESIDEQMEQSLLAKIHAAQAHWKKVLAELLFAFESLGDHVDLDESFHDTKSRDADDNNNNSNSNSSHNNNAAGYKPGHSTSGDDGQGQDHGNKIFFHRCKAFAMLLEEQIDTAFEITPNDRLPAVLQRLVPQLNRIYDFAQELLQRDTTARQSESLDYCFDDLICSDLTPSLRQYVSEGARISLPILDESVHKAQLQRQVDHLLAIMDKKADKMQLVENEAVTRSLLQHKVDLMEFKTVTSKLASNAEVQRLSQLVNEGRSVGQGTAGQFVSSRNQQAAEINAENISEIPAFAEVQSKCESLSQLYHDLRNSTLKMVPKEEVAEALKAVILELKQLRRNAVTQQVFKDGLKLKADTKEVDRIMRSIAEVLGDINLTAADLNAQGLAAAFHAKCLLCDKPVTNGRARTVRSGGVGMSVSRSSPALDESLLPAIGSKPQSANQPTRVKTASDVAIMRTGLDNLPDITDSLDSPRGGGGGGGGGGRGFVAAVVVGGAVVVVVVVVIVAVVGTAPSATTTRRRGSCSAMQRGQRRHR